VHALAAPLLEELVVAPLLDELALAPPAPLLEELPVLPELTATSVPHPGAPARATTAASTRTHARVLAITRWSAVRGGPSIADASAVAA
jgi:hypothetical protein